MSLTLTLHTVPEVPLEAEALSPYRVAGLSGIDVAKLPVMHGNRSAELGDFFRAVGRGDGELRIEGDLARVKFIGAAMSEGRVVVEGTAGMHLGAGMKGGEIVVEGNCGDWVGPEMSGGRIVIKGNAGHMVGSAVRGSLSGISGGEIIVHGNAGNEAGSAMRRGLIAIGGDCGDFAGVNMIAGTIIVLGTLGWRSGAGMKRGTVVSMHGAEMLPTFSRAGSYSPVFLRLYLLHLREAGLPVADEHINGIYQRWSGDAVETNHGEILLRELGSRP